MTDSDFEEWGTSESQKSHSKMFWSECSVSKCAIEKDLKHCGFFHKRYVEQLLTMASQFIFLPSIILAGIMFPVNMLPKVLENVGENFPATWGFKLMTSESFDIKLIIPLAIILFATACISGYQLSKISLE